jgi:hypothetical protein
MSAPPSPTSLLPRGGKLLALGAAAYVGTQVLVGVELGVASAWLVLAQGWSLATALAVTLPAGLPLIVAHLAILTLATVALRQ